VRVLFAASEIFPFAKTGGLADVAQALPRALSSHIEIICVMPLYSFIDRSALELSKLNFEIKLADNLHRITLFKTKNAGVKTYFIHSELLDDADAMYEGGAYDNNDKFFGIFSAAIAQLAKSLSVDIVHLNDWHCGLAALYLKKDTPKIKTIFTIHNLAYQGLFDSKELAYFGIDKQYFTLEGLEFYGQVSFLKAGVLYSDAVTTVSPRYAKEIMTPEFGCGLHAFLQTQKSKISGILNGIDFELFNPQTDEAIKVNYNAESIELKYKNKKYLTNELSLKNPDRELFVMLGRLVQQKGFELLIDALEDILTQDINLVVLVDGVNIYRSKLEHFAKKFENLKLVYGYTEDLTHRLYAGGDFLLMPSVFEPCGLNQLIAMRYGTIPIVHRVGGLYDSVDEDKMRCGEGFVFYEYSVDALVSSVKRALKMSKAKKDEIQRLDMQCDFSFESSSLEYLKLYKRLVG
jgi:starch synthase